ncbi:MAG: aldehyde dehydrogenase family protein [Deltaproteobacteria bacterium]|nr:aldehyde dehydrogenase family protein [Deltaproteobacteria bacterium]
MADARQYKLFIGGEFVDAADGAVFESRNPFNQELVATCALAGPADVDRAVAAARKTFESKEWQKLTGADRGAILDRLAGLVQKNLSDLAKLEAADSGSIMLKAMSDMSQCIATLKYYAECARRLNAMRPLELFEKPIMSANYVYKEPVGVVGQIIPWNFPLVMFCWKIGPALAAGCTVVIKPALETPSTAMEFARFCGEAGVPAGAINIVPGGAEAGERISSHPGIDKVAFTGSTAIGRRVMEVASGTLKRVTLECGGKSANIVLEDADLDQAIDGSMWATFFHAGQACESGTRLFLPEKLHDQFVEKLAEKTRKIRLGDPAQMTTQMGPVVSERQQKRILGYIQSGREQGAEAVTGGGKPAGEAFQKGWFIEPTVFVAVKNDMKIAQEEIFGPVLSVLKYKDVDEAVALANDSIYGLGGGVWSKSNDKALAVAKRLRTGTVWINEWHMLNVKAPFGGYKQSGIGREFGEEGLEAYLETKHLHIDLIGTRSKKVWYDMIAPRG